jgi:hypothetical protein
MFDALRSSADEISTRSSDMAVQEGLPGSGAFSLDPHDADGPDEGTESDLLQGVGHHASPELRLQILTTEHWSLLSTRSLSWNEAFSRSSMFLSVLSGAVVALALVAEATAFGDGFVTFALLILPVVLFVGVVSFARLVAINHEDVGWVVGMNLLRHAYLELSPELRDYFITGSNDDERGVMATYGATPGPGSFAHEFVTTPGMLAVINGVVAGILAGIVALQLGALMAFAVALGVTIALVTCALLVIHQYRGVVKPRGRRPARFPHAGPPN